jgi:iron complex outermembrane recepter protein
MHGGMKWHAFRASAAADKMRQNGMGETATAGVVSGWMRVLLVSLAVLSPSLHAQSAIDLPAQPLGSALVRLAGEMGVNILAPDALVAGRQAPAVSGRLTLHDALERVLNGSGLKAVRHDDKTYVIEQGAQVQPAPPVAPDSVLPTIAVNAGALPDDSGFVAFSSDTAARTDTPIDETPQSVQVITSDQIKSHQTQSTLDALGMAGLAVVNESQGNAASVYVRGFSASFMRNGILDLAANPSVFSLPMAAIDRIEILKGADSILAGAMYPGGTVNVVTKQPTANPVRELTVQTGSYGDWLGTVDLGGGLTRDNRLTYRLVVSGERSGESSGGYDGNKMFYLAPSLGWKSGGSEIVVGYQHQFRDVPGTPITLVGPDGPLPLGARPTPPNTQAVRSDTIFADLKQKFGSIWEIESRTQYQSAHISTVDNYFPVGPVDAMWYSGFTGSTRVAGVGTDNHIKATFRIGPIKNTLMGGAEYQVYRTDVYGVSSMAIADFPAPTLPPVSGDSYEVHARYYFSNLYLQDQVSWSRLRLLVSLARGASWSDNQPSQAAWLPSVGVLYQLGDYVSVFANALRSFNTNTFSPLVGAASPPPSVGRSIEAGIKFSLLDDQLSVTAGVFRSATSNNYFPDRGSPGGYVATAAEAYRGGELNVAGRLLPGLNLTLNYTYTTAQYMPVGSTPPARHIGSLWLSYDLQSEQFRGWGGGIGLRTRSGFDLSTTPQEYRVPGQMQTDLNVHYQTRRWSAILGIKNVFNRTLYQDNAYYVNIVTLNPGRLIYLTSSYKF